MLNLSFKKVLLILVSVAVLVLLVVSLATLYFIKANKSLLGASGKKYQSGQNQLDSDILKPGTVGEVKATDGASPNIQLPPVIFNTSGTITEIKANSIIVKGDGSSFADDVSRDLNAIFSPQTITFVSLDQKIIKHQGLEGLDYLKIGDKVLVEGDENLRGKTEFKARTINILP